MAIEHKLKLKDQQDDTYVLCIERKDELRGIYVVIDLNKGNGSIEHILARLQNAIYTLGHIQEDERKKESATGNTHE